MRTNETRDDLSDLEDPNHPHPAIVRKREMDAAQKAETDRLVKEVAEGFGLTEETVRYVFVR